MDTAGEQTLGWSMLSDGRRHLQLDDSSASAAAAAWSHCGASGVSLVLSARAIARPDPRTDTPIYLAFNVLFVITLAFASHSAAGGTTVLSYAYLFASYLIAGTGMALGMSSIPDMTRDARTRGHDARSPKRSRGASATR